MIWWINYLHLLLTTGICLIFLILFQTGRWYLYKKIDKIADDSANVSWLKQIIIFPVIAGLLVLVGRGGIGLRPVAARQPFIQSNRIFRLYWIQPSRSLKPWGSLTLEEKNYYTESELKSRFNPVKLYKRENPITNSNVVVLILESFSVEYIGSINGTNTTYTPFLELIDWQFTGLYQLLRKRKKIHWCNAINYIIQFAKWWKLNIHITIRIQ